MRLLGLWPFWLPRNRDMWSLQKFIYHTQKFLFTVGFLLWSSAILFCQWQQKTSPKVPMIERLCLCGSDKIEIIKHLLLHCNYYKEIQIKFLPSILGRYLGWSEKEISKTLLFDCDLQFTLVCAGYLAAAYRIQQDEVKQI